MRRDDAYLLDMLVAARKAVAFATELTHQEFARSDLHQNAILKVCWRLSAKRPPA